MMMMMMMAGAHVSMWHEGALAFKQALPNAASILTQALRPSSQSDIYAALQQK
jgi:hypothetical protein